MKSGETGFARLVSATRYSFQGIRACWQHEAAFRQEASLAKDSKPVTSAIDIDADWCVHQWVDRPEVFGNTGCEFSLDKRFHGLGFPDEAFPLQFVGSVFLAEHLEGDESILLDFQGLVDHAGSSAAQYRSNLVTGNLEGAAPAGVLVNGETEESLGIQFSESLAHQDLESCAMR